MAARETLARARARSCFPAHVASVNAVDAREADRRRRRVLAVVDRPDARDEHARDAERRLEDVGVRDREEAAARRVQEHDEARDADRARHAHSHRVAQHRAAADEVAREQRHERDDRDEPAEHLDRGAVAAPPEVGEREEVLVVHVPGEEDAVDDEREPEPDRQHRAVVVVELVREVRVAEHRVRVDALRRERERADGQRERAAGDEVVVRLAADEEGRAEPGGAEHEDRDHDDAAEAVGRARVRAVPPARELAVLARRQPAHPRLAALTVPRACGYRAESAAAARGGALGAAREERELQMCTASRARRSTLARARAHRSGAQRRGRDPRHSSDRCRSPRAGRCRGRRRSACPTGTPNPCRSGRQRER